MDQIVVLAIFMIVEKDERSMESEVVVKVL